MGLTRNGARTFLSVIAKACQLSHMPGFRSGLTTILGGDAAGDLYALWVPFCSMVESIIALDSWYNKRDATLPDLAGGEDHAFG